MRNLIVLAALTTGLAPSAHAAQTRYDKITADLKAMETGAPQVAKVVSIGKNDEGTAIQALRVSLRPEMSDSLRIAHLVVGTHHGNEGAAATTAMAFAKKLVGKFQSGAVYREGLVETEWLIVPVLNISGYNKNSRYERSVDPNRDYPSPCVSQPGGKLKSTTLLRQVFDARAYVGSVTLHGYIGTMTYPWGVNVSDPRTRDHNAFERVTRKAAEVNGYRYGTSTDVVYPADGTYEDWAYWKHGNWTLLIEMKDGSASDVTKTVDAMFVYFNELDQAPSTHHALESGCQRAGALDRGDE